MNSLAKFFRDTVAVRILVSVVLGVVVALVVGNTLFTVHYARPYYSDERGRGLLVA